MEFGTVVYNAKTSMQLVDRTVRADETTGSPPFHFQFRSYLPVTR